METAHATNKPSNNTPKKRAPRAARKTPEEIAAELGRFTTGNEFQKATVRAYQEAQQDLDGLKSAVASAKKRCRKLLSILRDVS